MVHIMFTGNYLNGYEISAGSTANFKLVATNVAHAQTNDSITVRLANAGTYLNKFIYDQLTPFAVTNTQYTGENTLTKTTGNINIATGTLSVNGYGKLETSTIAFTGNDQNATGTSLSITVLDKAGNTVVSYKSEINVSLTGSHTITLNFPDKVIENANSNYTYTVNLEYT